MGVLGWGKQVVRRWADIYTWPNWAWGVVLLQSVIALLLQLTVAWRDLFFYSGQLGAAFGIVYWLVAALITFFSILSIARASTWTLNPLIVSQSMILLSCLYVFWMDGMTVSRNVASFLVVLPLGVVSLLVIPPTILGLRQRLPSTMWKYALALLPALGFLQFWIQEELWPSFESPLLLVEAQLTQIGSDGSKAYVRADVEISNQGRVDISVPAAFVHVSGVPRSVESEPEEHDVATVAYAAVNIVAGEHGYRRDIDYGVNGEQATAVIGPGLALLENMVGFRWFLAPGERYSRSFAFAVDSETVGRLDLAVEALVYKDVTLGVPETCPASGERVDYQSVDFWSHLTVYDEDLDSHSICWVQRTVPSGAIDGFLQEDTMVMLGYDLDRLNDSTYRRFWSDYQTYQSGAAVPLQGNLKTSIVQQSVLTELSVLEDAGGSA